ncbi:MAG: radical SAM protein [Actinobacteria bacterium]|nr:MAG: radical SAM protein [Actinomycetota bacterium]
MTDASDTASVPPGPLPVSLYVHVPFCGSKCAYCDFHSAAEDPSRLITDADGVVYYVRSRLPEAASLADAFVECVLAYLEEFSVDGLLVDVPTLYVGGGTPTLLGPALPRMVRGIRELVGLRRGAEITVEANPCSLTPALAAALADEGVTRVSLGVQSFDDEVLHTLGRAHDAAQAREAAGLVAAAGMRLSLDLMCGVPGQSAESWAETLRAAVECGAGHASVYRWRSRRARRWRPRWLRAWSRSRTRMWQPR